MIDQHANILSSYVWEKAFVAAASGSAFQLKKCGSCAENLVVKRSVTRGPHQLFTAIKMSGFRTQSVRSLRCLDRKSAAGKC